MEGKLTTSPFGIFPKTHTQSPAHADYAEGPCLGGCNQRGALLQQECGWVGAWGISSPAHLPWARNELSDHLDAMDSNLDNLQTMLTSHGFSVDTSALLDLFSPSVTMPDMSLPDLDSSLASIQELLSPQEPPRPIEAENSNADSGKQLVHYTAQPLFLLDPDAVDTGSSELPVLFELGESSYFSEGDDYTDDPTISLLTGTEPHKAKDPTVS